MDSQPAPAPAERPIQNLRENVASLMQKSYTSLVRTMSPSITQEVAMAIPKAEDVKIKSIRILSGLNQYLQISQLCVNDNQDNNIAAASAAHLETIDASESFKQGANDGSKEKAVDGNCTVRNFPDIYHSAGNTGEQYWKLTFKIPQGDISICYYNRSIHAERMNGGRLQLLGPNDEVLLTFNMTGEKVQCFSNDRIKHMKHKGDHSQDQINEYNRQHIEKQRIAEAHRVAEERRVAQERRIAEERRTAEIAESQRVAEERRTAEIAESQRVANERRIAEEILTLIPQISSIQANKDFKLQYFEYHVEAKSYVVCIYVGDICICNIEVGSGILYLHIKNGVRIVQFNSLFPELFNIFDIIYFCKEQIRFDFNLLQIDLTNYTRHDLTLKYSVLISNTKPELLALAYNEKEGINQEYVGIGRRADGENKYCINLMWVSIEPLFVNNFLLKPEYFGKLELFSTANPNSKIIFWYDGDIQFTTLMSIVNTRLYFNGLNRADDQTGKIYLRDLSMNPLVMRISILSPYLFGPVTLYGIENKRLPLYFRVDLYRIVIIIYLLTEPSENVDFVVYSDIDITPQCISNTTREKVYCRTPGAIQIVYNHDYLFNAEVLAKLDEHGIIMQAGSAKLSFENSFQIVGSNNPTVKQYIIKALEICMLYSNIAENVFESFENKPFNTINKLELKGVIEQNVYGMYKLALILSKILNQQNGFALSTNDLIQTTLMNNLFAVSKEHILSVHEITNIYSVRHTVGIERVSNLKLPFYDFADFGVSAFFYDLRQPSKLNERIFIGGKSRNGKSRNGKSRNGKSRSRKSRSRKRSGKCRGEKSRKTHR